MRLGDTIGPLKFVVLLEAALARRRYRDAVNCVHEDVRCEVCGDLIHVYCGFKPGVVCSFCMEESGEGFCTHISPLAITRSTLNE